MILFNIKVYEEGMEKINLMCFIMSFVLIVDDINDNVLNFIKFNYIGSVDENVKIFIFFDKSIEVKDID